MYLWDHAQSGAPKRIPDQQVAKVDGSSYVSHDFHNFGEHKTALRGQGFQTDDGDKECVHNWIKRQPNVF